MDKAFFSTPNGDGTYRMLDSRGRTIGPDSYNFCNVSGSTLVFECGEQWLAYRDDGTPLELPEGYLPSHEEQGVLVAFRGDYAGVLSLDGEEVVPCVCEDTNISYLDARDVWYGTIGVASFQRQGKTGLVSSDGETLFEGPYFAAMIGWEHGPFLVMSEGWRAARRPLPMPERSRTGRRNPCPSCPVRVFSTAWETTSLPPPRSISGRRPLRLRCVCWRY